MKLSEKGLKSFADQMLDIAIGLNEKEVEWDRDFAMRQIEFESDDFQGVVVLTVEEAKAVNEAIEWLCSTLEDYERERDNTPALEEGWNQMDFLESKLKRMEK